MGICESAHHGKNLDKNDTKKENIYGDYDTCTMQEWTKQKYFESPDDNTIFLLFISLLHHFS